MHNLYCLIYPPPRKKTNKQTNNQTETENIQRKKKAIFSSVKEKNMKDKKNYDAIFLPLATRNSSCSFILIF